MTVEEALAVGTKVAEALVTAATLGRDISLYRKRTRTYRIGGAGDIRDADAGEWELTIVISGPARIPAPDAPLLKRGREIVIEPGEPAT